MAEAKVTTKDAFIKRSPKGASPWKRRWWVFGVVGVVVVMSGITTFKVITAAPEPREAPETARVLRAQEAMGNFGILIPSYLPRAFDRAGVEIQVAADASKGVPAVDMTYRAQDNAALFVRQWVPVNPELEILSGSKPIETRWGKAWLLSQTNTLVCVWVDVGPLRVSLSTNDLKSISKEQLVMAAETLALASNSQAFSFVAEAPQIRDVAPPPPFEVKLNDAGVQELNLTITPGGYSPMRFAVKRGTPLKINFRALGEVGCGNVVLLPTGGGNFASLEVSKYEPSQSITFTPGAGGDFQFYCGSYHYRGIMTVRE